jgi:hypothetical protein
VSKWSVWILLCLVRVLLHQNRELQLSVFLHSFFLVLYILLLLLLSCHWFVIVAALAWAVDPGPGSVSRRNFCSVCHTAVKNSESLIWLIYPKVWCSLLDCNFWTLQKRRIFWVL